MVFILIIKSDPQSKHQKNGIDIEKTTNAINRNTS